MSDEETMKANGIDRMEIHATMEAAWDDLQAEFFSELPPAQRASAEYCFYAGVRAAANLVIFSAGAADSIDGALDQIAKEVVAYDDRMIAAARQREETLRAALQ